MTNFAESCFEEKDGKNILVKNLKTCSDNIIEGFTKEEDYLKRTYHDCAYNITKDYQISPESHLYRIFQANAKLSEKHFSSSTPAISVNGQFLVVLYLDLFFRGDLMKLMFWMRFAKDSP